MTASRQLNGSIPNPTWLGSTFFGGLLCVRILGPVAPAAGGLSGFVVVAVCPGPRTGVAIRVAVAGSGGKETCGTCIVSRGRRSCGGSTQRGSPRDCPAVWIGGGAGADPGATPHSSNAGKGPPAVPVPL